MNKEKLILNLNWTREMLSKLDEYNNESENLKKERMEWENKKYTGIDASPYFFFWGLVGIIGTAIFWGTKYLLSLISLVEKPESFFTNPFFLFFGFIALISLIIMCTAEIPTAKRKKKEQEFNASKIERLKKIQSDLDITQEKIIDIREEISRNSIVKDEDLYLQKVSRLITWMDLGYANTYDEAVTYDKRRAYEEEIERQKEEARRRHTEALHQERLKQERELADRAYKQREEHNREVNNNIRVYGYYE